MSAKSSGEIRKYGLRFSEAQFSDPIAIELYLYAMDKVRASSSKTLTAWEHLRNAMKMLLPERIFTWHPWVDTLGESWCETNAQTVWGASSTTKSGVMGFILLADLLADPMNTLTVLVTQPMEKHWDRCWGNVVRWQGNLPESWRIGTVKKAPSLGLLTSDGEDKRAGIVCISCMAGDSFEDLKSKIGAHQKRNRLAVDEPQGASESVLQIKVNMAASGEYKEAFFGNPDSWFSPLGKHSMPKDGDTAKILKEMPDRWFTQNKVKGKQGICVVLDGFRAPSLKEPDRYPFMIQPDFVEDSIANFGADSKHVWTYVRGRIPPGGTVDVLMSEPDLMHFGANKKPFWVSGFQSWAVLDPSRGGDGCPLSHYGVGMARFPDGEIRKMCVLIERKHLKITMSDPNVSRQIAAQAIPVLRQWGVPLSRLGGDSTGGQGAVLDYLEGAVNSPAQGSVIRISSEGGASERSVIVNRRARAASTGKGNKTILASSIYANRAAEIAGNLVQLIRARSFCGLDTDSIHQISTRLLDPTSLRTKLEEKKDWRDRNSGRSPDEMDCDAIMATILLERGIIKADSIGSDVGIDVAPVVDEAAAAVAALNQGLPQAFQMVAAGKLPPSRSQAAPSRAYRAIGAPGRSGRRSFYR